VIQLQKLFARSPYPAVRAVLRPLTFLAAFALATVLAAHFGSGGLWRGFEPSLAIAKPGENPPYDLTRLEAVNQTLKYIRNRYVDPGRVKPREMLLSALDFIQRDVAEVIVLPAKGGEVTIRVDTQEQRLRVDDVLGPWDVAAKLRQVFAFLQKNLNRDAVDLRQVEYTACNGMLHTLDPHSVFMSPEDYKEMNLSTSGHFGGLGIVISIRDQLLTIMRPMPDTPAGRAGLKRGDRVLKINNESTLNMPLDDAVKRLRGKAGTEVTVWVSREGPEGWAGTRKFVLVRERIEVRSVLAKRLDDGIGYVRLKQFQQTSTDELTRALNEFRAQGELRGLVLDLRGNPGGLLDQAAAVADKFLTKGTIVATVGASEGREEKVATAAETEPGYPMVVLVNGSSASASEIVAGALKNLGRAVIVGQTTFGKGSVQLVFPDVTRDHAALKLTIAQYLTPGDTSIQGVGVTPHIELDPMTVDPLEMNITLRSSGMRERDLSKHLSSGGSQAPSVPAQVVRYYLPKEQRETLRELGGELEDEFQLDYPTELARQLASKLPAGRDAAAQLRTVCVFIEASREAEVAKVSQELAKLGLDWTVPKDNPVPGPSKDELEVKVETDRSGNRVQAGEPMSLMVTVKNKGTTPVYRLRATTESDSAYYDEKELVFGKIAPGESKTAVTPLAWCEVEGRQAGTLKPRPENAKRVCKIPMDALDRSDGLKVHFDAAGGHAPASVEIRPTILALARPLFQYSYQIADDIQGNGDGLIQKGEQVTLYLTARNVGPGRSFETQANLANRSGDGLLLRKGRFEIDNMQPGEMREVTFTFDVESQLGDPEAVLGLSVGDRDLREFATEKIQIPIVAPVAVAAASGAVTATSDALLYPDVSRTGDAFGRVASGTALRRLGQTAAMTKIELAPGRFAFVATRDLADGGAPAATVRFEQIYTHAPPTLQVRTDDVATRQERIKVRVDASDSDRLLDLYMFVGARKLYYQSNRTGADPKHAGFEFDAPLEPGVNFITVVARKNADTTTRRTVVVRRDAADGSILKTATDADPLLAPTD
jgi:carboxyl-terminal processing protease